MLAELPWYALPLLLLVPLAVALPAPERAPLIARAAVLSVYALAAAALPILAAWYAARGSLHLILNHQEISRCRNASPP